MNNDGIVKSSCDLCSQFCGVLLHMKNGEVIEVEGDPDSPINKGKLCIKGRALLEYAYHPDRLKYPLRRLGERGGGKWQRISWDEALDRIANEWTEARDKYGAESVTIIRGARKGLQDDYMARLTNVFGTPNNSTQSSVCFIPRQLGSVITCGFYPFPDYQYPPACIVTWGANIAETRLGEYELTLQALDRGAKLIVIDPRKIDLTDRADFWVQLRPGSDLALALGLINVIVNEGLFDMDFVNNWTVGFDELKAHIQDYSPEKVSDITWVKAETIRQVARFYARNKPSCIQDGNGLDQSINSFQTSRAISILRAITGNLNKPGGDLQSEIRGLPRADHIAKLRLPDKLPIDKWKRMVGAGYTIPTFHEALPQLIQKAIIEEDPYAIRVAYVQAANPLITWPNQSETYKAFNKLDFISVTDMFMTPTAALADIVLPSAGCLEFDSITQSPYHPVVQVQQKVIEVGECWSDYKIIKSLARRLHLEDYFWKNSEEFLDTVLESTGLRFKELRQIGSLVGAKEYRSYELEGLQTPTRKVEIYSERLKKWGFDPLPTYYEPPETPYSEPEITDKYPFLLISWKSVAYRHSQGRQVSSLRSSHPDPMIIIHPKTSRKLGIKEGDWVYIETKRGKIKQKANVSNTVDPRVVGLDYAWWFPEKGPTGLYGWGESNINALTDNKPPFSREIGSTNLRGILCNVLKA